MNKLETLKKKIRYRASYRGTKEMDIILNSFIESIIDNLDANGLESLSAFLDNEDEKIYGFYKYGKPLNKFKDKRILDLFKKFKI